MGTPDALHGKLQRSNYVLTFPILNADISG